MEFRRQGNICMGKIEYQFFFFPRKKGTSVVSIFRTCAVLLSFVDDGVWVVVRSVQIYDLVTKQRYDSAYDSVVNDQVKTGLSESEELN